MDICTYEAGSCSSSRSDCVSELVYTHTHTSTLACTYRTRMCIHAQRLLAIVRNYKKVSGDSASRNCSSSVVRGSLAINLYKLVVPVNHFARMHAQNSRTPISPRSVSHHKVSVCPSPHSSASSSIDRAHAKKYCWEIVVTVRACVRMRTA